MTGRPYRLQIGKSSIADVRHMFPPLEGSAVARPRRVEDLVGDAIHHDGVIMAPGDRDYNGTTLDEDLERLQAIYNKGLSEGWGGPPYQLVASPNGRTFYLCDVGLFGAHVARRNHELLGVAFMGHLGGAWPRGPQLCAAGLALVAAWHLTGRLRPVRGHCEWALPMFPTVCPGSKWRFWQRDLLMAAVAQARIAFPDL